jgi:hypothetical protein
MSESTKPPASTAATVVSLLIVGAFVWFFYGGGAEREAAAHLDDVERTMASDAAAQYEIAKRHGSAMDACIAARHLSAAYLRAKEEAKYAAAKQVEHADCVKAGLSR